LCRKGLAGLSAVRRVAVEESRRENFVRGLILLSCLVSWRIVGKDLNMKSKGEERVG
jgi:hypothetical protein